MDDDDRKVSYSPETAARLEDEAEEEEARQAAAAEAAHNKDLVAAATELVQATWVPAVGDSVQLIDVNDTSGPLR